MSNVIGIKPCQFVHVLDLNKNIVSLEFGPKTYVVQANEKLVCGPLPFVVVPPGSYCRIKDPCSKYVKGEQAVLKHGHYAVRFHGEPFPLYPGEILVGAENFTSSGQYKQAMHVLPALKQNHAIQLVARIDFVESDGTKRCAGDKWQVEGPTTYRPVPEVDMAGFVEPQVIQAGQALRLRATQDTVDKQGISRVTAEEWLVTKPGAYLPGVFEQVVGLEESFTLTAKTALHLIATQNCVDALGKERVAGEEWLVTLDDTESLPPQIGIDLKKTVRKTILRRSEYCVVMDPLGEDSKPQLSKKEVRKGVSSFFLHPGEQLESGIQQAHILARDEALVLLATDEFIDTSGDKEKKRLAGERWMIKGPQEYIPPVEVNIIDNRRAIPLSKNEGVYVRNIQTGKVRAVMGPQSYLLSATEELWEKDLTSQVDFLLQKGGGHGEDDIRKIAYFEQSVDPTLYKNGKRDKTKVVAYRCPGNTACQIYNYLTKTARVIFGPELVILGPHENFHVLSLSAGKPKKADRLKSLCLMLGPDFITDIIVVETSDHARLQIRLAFNNYFEVDKSDPESVARIFSVNDFIGFACKQIGSKIRGAVAHIPFDEFHRHSSKVIQHAVFDRQPDGSFLTSLKFAANSLVVSSIDVQSIEPVDQRMRDSLMKSVQMAIEIATQSIEAAASHEAKRVEQAAQGELDRQKLDNEIQAEKERAKLFKLQAITAAVESTGQAKAEARARAESMRIECQSQIECTKLKSQAESITHTAELKIRQMLRACDLAYNKSLNDAETYKLRKLTEIEVAKYANMVSTLGAGTIAAIANSGPAMQVKLLASLGIESTMITDGNTPINLFSTASGLVPIQSGSA